MHQTPKDTSVMSLQPLNSSVDTSTICLSALEIYTWNPKLWLNPARSKTEILSDVSLSPHCSFGSQLSLLSSKAQLRTSVSVADALFVADKFCDNIGVHTHTDTHTHLQTGSKGSFVYQLQGGVFSYCFWNVHKCKNVEGQSVMKRLPCYVFKNRFVLVHEDGGPGQVWEGHWMNSLSGFCCPLWACFWMKSPHLIWLLDSVALVLPRLEHFLQL